MLILGKSLLLRHGGMSALGQKQTCAPQKVMSALPPKADMCGATGDVRFVPIADKARQKGGTAHIRGTEKRSREWNGARAY